MAQQQCRKKVAYEDKIEAMLSAAWINNNSVTEAQYPYACPICKRWHLTKEKPKGWVKENSGE